MNEILCKNNCGRTCYFPRKFCSSACWGEYRAKEKSDFRTQVAELYKSGLTMVQVARAVNRSRQRIQQILIKEGLWGAKDFLLRKGCQVCGKGNRVICADCLKAVKRVKRGGTQVFFKKAICIGCDKGKTTDNINLCQACYLFLRYHKRQGVRARSAKAHAKYYYKKKGVVI